MTDFCTFKELSTPSEQFDQINLTAFILSLATLSLVFAISNERD